MTKAQPIHLLYAPFWKRVIASLLDSIMMMIPCAIIMVVTYLAAGFLVTKRLDLLVREPGIVIASSALLSSILFSVWGVFFLLAFSFFHASRWQATPGKRLMKLYVTGEDGKRISFKRAALRALLVVAVMTAANLFSVLEDTARQNAINARNEEITLNYMPKLREELAQKNLSFADYLLSRLGVASYKKHLETLSTADYNKLTAEVEEASKEPVDLPVYWRVGGCVLLILFIGWYTMILWTPYRTAFHDYLARTRVVEGRPHTFKA